MTCPHCTHFRRPGLSAGYCGGREDLPPAYGENHPLKQIPADILAGRKVCETLKGKT